MLTKVCACILHKLLYWEPIFHLIASFSNIENLLQKSAVHVTSNTDRFDSAAEAQAMDITHLTLPSESFPDVSYSRESYDKHPCASAYMCMHLCIFKTLLFVFHKSLQGKNNRTMNIHISFV